MLPFIVKLRRLANMKKGRAMQYFISFALSLATVTMGALAAWPTQDLSELINKEVVFFAIDDTISIILEISAPGFILGSFAGGCISDTAGRKITILASSAPFVLGTVLANTVYDSSTLYFTKFLWGFGSGSIISVVNMYLAEVSDKEIRGALSICTGFMFNFGSLLAVLFGTISFSSLNYIMLVLPLIFFVTCLGIPESPYYYLKEGEVDLAKRSLMKLRGGENIKEELEMLQEQVKKEMKNSKSPPIDFFTSLTYWHPIVIASGLKVAEILTGVVAIQQYVGRVKQDIRKDTLDGPAEAMDLLPELILFGAFKCVICLISSVLVDILGRRPLLMSSFVCTGVIFGLGSFYFILEECTDLEKTELYTLRYVPFLSIIFSTVISIWGFHTVIGIIMAEIFPLNVRAVAISSLNAFGGILSLIVPKLYHVIKNSFGYSGIFCLFSCEAFIGAIFATFIVPETKGKSLNEIQKMLIIRKDDVPNANHGIGAVKVDETQELVEPKKKDVK